eukprot:8579874-Pyramimonas_sp.AAC.1
MVSRGESGPDSPRETPRRGQGLLGSSPRPPSAADDLPCGIGAVFSTGNTPLRTRPVGGLPESRVRGG